MFWQRIRAEYRNESPSLRVVSRVACAVIFNHHGLPNCSNNFVIDNPQSANQPGLIVQSRIIVNTYLDLTPPVYFWSLPYLPGLSRHLGLSLLIHGLSCVAPPLPLDALLPPFRINVVHQRLGA